MLLWNRLTTTYLASRNDVDRPRKDGVDCCDPQRGGSEMQGLSNTLPNIAIN